MGTERINAAIEALRAAGIRAAHSYPGGRIPQLTGPVCSVGLQKWQPGKTCSISVRLYCPPEQTGATCQEVAAQTAQILEQLGAQCSVGACSFEDRTGLFTAQVLAEWSETSPGFSVRVGNVALPHVTGLKANRDRAMTQTETRDEGWYITVTEQLPLAQPPQADDADSFDLTVTTAGGSVVYRSCRWSELTYSPGADGVIRCRVARCWGEREIV